MRPPLVQGLVQLHPGCGAAAEQLAAVGHQHLEHLWRYLGKFHCQGLRLEHQRHGVGKHHRVRPGGKALGDDFLALGEQRRGGFFLLQATGDQGGVAVDVGPHLQHRRLAIAPGERGEVRLGHHRRNQHRVPRQALEAQQQAGFFSEGGLRVVVQDQLRHTGLRSRSERLA